MAYVLLSWDDLKIVITATPLSNSVEIIMIPLNAMTKMRLIINFSGRSFVAKKVCSSKDLA